MNLPIGSRVRLRGGADLGTTLSDPYVFRGQLQVGVVWDATPRWHETATVSYLVLVTHEPVGVPVEARPYSVGAMAGGVRWDRERTRREAAADRGFGAVLAGPRGGAR